MLFETGGLAASGATLAEPEAAVVPLAAGADVEAVPVWVAPACTAVVLVAGALLWPPALVAAAVVCEELADCPAASELSAGAAVPVVAAIVVAVPVTVAGAVSPLAAVAVVVAGALLDSLLADEVADWPVAAEPAVD